MKITRNRPDQLIIGETPWLMAGVTLFFTLVFTAVAVFLLFQGIWVGLIFFAGTALGIGGMWAFVRRIQIVLHAPSATLTFRERSITGYTQIVHSLSDVTHAIIETSNSDGTTLSRVSIILTGESEGTHPISQVFSNIGDHQGICTAINDWLDSHRSQT
jgi:hypothetical protein